MPSAPSRNDRPGFSAGALLGLLRIADADAAASAPAQSAPQAWDAILDLALRHGVAPLLQRALRSNGRLALLPQSVRTRLDEASRAVALDNLRNYGQFRRIATALTERGVPLIALKGLHLAELVYRDISLRPMADLDILVPHAQVDAAVAALAALDFELSNKAPGGYDLSLSHRSLGTLVEVHWTLATPEEPYTPPIEHIWRSAVTVRLGDAQVQVMSPEFLLLHVCTHLACHHLFAFDLRALCDIVEIVQAHPDLDWDTVVDQGRRHGWERGVAAALRLARDHLGAAVPADALAAIGGDRLAPELLDDALEQLGTTLDLPGETRFAPNLMALAGASGVGAKLRVACGRIFLPRAELARIYGVPEQSLHMPLLYVRRLRDLLRAYAPNLWAAGVSDPQFAASAARNARLAKWIAGG